MLITAVEPARAVPACAVLLVLAGACSEPRERFAPDASVEDAATGEDDAAAPDSRPYASSPSTCTLDAPTPLRGGPDMGSRLASDGRYVYFIARSTLQRAPIGGGESEMLVESASDFALVDGRLFVAPTLGGIEEHRPNSEPESLVGEPFPKRFAAAAEHLYFCAGDGFSAAADEPFYAFDVASSALTMHTTSPSRSGCVGALSDGAYWIERSASDARATRVMRMREGRGIDTLVDYSAGFDWAEVDDRSFALRTEDSVVLGATDGDARVELPVAGANDLRFIDEHLYFNVTRQCTPMPDFGNGTPACADDLLRVARDGGEVETVIEATAEVAAIAVDEACVYWVSVHTPCHPGCITSLMAAPLPKR